MSKKVVVIGSGIVGASCAYYLHKAGHEVVLLEKEQQGSGASYVNAGYITPSHIIPLAAPGMVQMGMKYLFDSSGPFYMKPRFDLDFIKWAWAFQKSCTKRNVQKAIPLIKALNIHSRELYEELLSGGDLGEFHWEDKGLLMVYKTQKAADSEGLVAEEARSLGLEVDQLDTNRLRELEPGFGEEVLGAWHYHCDRHSTPTDVLPRLLKYLRQHISFQKSKGVDHIKSTSQGVSLKCGQESLTADRVVIAAGVWSSQLAKQLGERLHLEAGKGYRIDVENELNIGMPAISLEHKIAVTPMKGFTRFAGTMEFSGINTTVRPERVAAIAKAAQSLYANLDFSEQDLASAATGMRPVSPDGLPYIGPMADHPNIYMATGHAMMGWSLGPVTGHMIADMISERTPVLDSPHLRVDRKF